MSDFTYNSGATNNALAAGGIPIELVIEKSSHETYLDEMIHEPFFWGNIHPERVPIKYELEKTDLVLQHIKALSAEQMANLIDCGNINTNSVLYDRFGEWWEKSEIFRRVFLEQLIEHAEDPDILTNLTYLVDATQNTTSMTLWYIHSEEATPEQLRNQDNLINQKAISDLLNTLASIYESKPEAADHLLAFVCQKLDLTLPHESIDNIKKILLSPGCSNITHRIIEKCLKFPSSMDYKYFKQALIEALGVSNEGSWKATATILKGLLSDLNQIQRRDFLQSFKEFYQQNGGSYLHYCFIEGQLRQGRIISAVEDPLRIKPCQPGIDGEELFRTLPPNIHLVAIDGNWYHYHNKNKDKILELIDSYAFYRRVLLESYFEYSDSRLRSTVETANLHFRSDRQTSFLDTDFKVGDELKKIETELSELVLDKFSIEDVAFNRPDLTPEERIERVYDFSDFCQLITDEGLGTIEGEFGIVFHELSGQEQFAFTRFAKKASLEEAEKITNFTKKYGIDALRAFLAVDYGHEYGQLLLNLPSIIGQDETRNILRSFNQVLLNSNNMLTSIIDGLKREGTDKEIYVSRIFIKQLQEAVLRRAKLLLLAPTTADFNSVYNLSDIHAGIKGLDKIFELLSDMSKGNIYNFIDDDPQKTNSGKENIVLVATNKKTQLKYKLRILARSHTTTDSKGRTIPARLNFELDFKTKNPDMELAQAYSHDVVSDGKVKNKQVLRIGIDLDSFYTPSRVSLDVGRGAFQGQHFQSTGCILGRLQTSLNTTNAKHHTIEPFSPEFGCETTFATVVTSIARSLSSGLSTYLINLTPPSPQSQ